MVQERLWVGRGAVCVKQTLIYFLNFRVRAFFVLYWVSIQIGFFSEKPLTKLAIQRLFTPRGLEYKSVWVGGEWPGADKGPDHWKEYCGKLDEGEGNRAYPAVHTGDPISDADYSEWHAAKPVKCQGKRSDLSEVKRRLDEGEDVNDIVQGSVEAFSAGAKHLAFFSAYQGQIKRRKEFEMPEVLVYYGATGTGKTRKAYEDMGYDLATTWRWTPGAGSTFFCGYTGQDNVIFDEFRGQIAMGNMLTLLDGYPMTVQIKGGSVAWSPKKVILTSPIHPKEWYSSMGDDRIEQLLRRIKKVTKFSLIV